MLLWYQAIDINRLLKIKMTFYDTNLTISKINQISVFLTTGPIKSIYINTNRKVHTLSAQTTLTL